MQSRNLPRRPASRAAHAIRTRRVADHSSHSELPTRRTATSCRKRNKRKEVGGVLVALKSIDLGALAPNSTSCVPPGDMPVDAVDAHKHDAIMLRGTCIALISAQK